MLKRLVLKNSGHSRLWLWFGLSRSSYMVLPRVLMHEMPDAWQAKMAKLLEEYDASWTHQPDLTAYVSLKQGTRYVKAPRWILDYRHPARETIEAFR